MAKTLDNINKALRVAGAFITEPGGKISPVQIKLAAMEICNPSVRPFEKIVTRPGMTDLVVKYRSGIDFMTNQATYNVVIYEKDLVIYKKEDTIK